MTRSMFKRNSVRRYPMPQYPRFRTIRQSIACEAPRSHRGIKRIIELMTLGAVPLALLTGCQTGDDSNSQFLSGAPSPIGHGFTESEVYTLFTSLAAFRGLEIQPNFEYNGNNVTFNADGYDQDKRVGYEFMTLTDLFTKDLSEHEIDLLQESFNKKGPYFLILREWDYSWENDQEEVATHTRIFCDITDFLETLVDHGVI
jgi:hypothetical protein